jgi:PBP1b-binding outer membrane lipoprotein LpoB
MISSYGDMDQDHMALDTQDLAHDPRFNRQTAPRQGQLKVARLSLRTQFLFRGARADHSAQNTYEVRLFVTDTETGEVVWEGFSDPIAKRTDKARIGF